MLYGYALQGAQEGLTRRDLVYMASLPPVIINRDSFALCANASGQVMVQFKARDKARPCSHSVPNSSRTMRITKVAKPRPAYRADPQQCPSPSWPFEQKQPFFCINDATSKTEKKSHTM